MSNEPTAVKAHINGKVHGLPIAVPITDIGMRRRSAGRATNQ